MLQTAYIGRVLGSLLALPALSLLLAGSAVGQTPVVADPLSREVAGWYALAPDHKVLVTWAPEGDELRLLDFDSARFAALRPEGESRFIWQVDERDRLVTFVRDESGAVRGLRWREEDGAEGFIPRADEFPFDQERIRFFSDSIELAGLVMVPRVHKYVGRVGQSLEEVPVVIPGAVLIHGSGSSDRDNVWAFHIAQHLARRGVAVLLPDKRGSGASGGDWRTADFDDLATDAIAAADALGRHPKVDRARIGFVGLSQGGWIAPLAANRRLGTAFVISVSAAAVSPGEQVRHEVRQDLVRSGLPEDGRAAVLDLLGAAEQYSRTLSDADWRAYALLREELSQGLFAEAIDGFPSSRDHWQWNWWHDVVDFDALLHWRMLDMPVLVVYGADDEHDNVPVEESVRLLRPILAPERHHRNEIRVFEDTGHALGDAKTGWIRSDFLELLSDWLREHVGEERDR